LHDSPVTDEIPLPPDEPVLPPHAPRPRWQSIGLAVGAVLLGVAVVIGGAFIGGGLIGNAGPSASGQPSSTASSSSLTPSPSSEPSSTAPAPTPTGSPRPLNSAFAIFPAQPPTDMPSITCTGPIGATDPVALVYLRPTDPAAPNPVVLRDYADVHNPRTVCTFPNSDPTQLIDAHHVVVGGAGPSLFAVVDLPEVRFQWFQLPPHSESVASEFIAVSPELDAIVWMRAIPNDQTGDYTKREIHITTTVGDSVVASLPDEPTGFCGAPLDYSKHGAFSVSGEHLYVLDQPRSLQPVAGGGIFAGASQYSLRVFAGTQLVYSVLPPSGGWLGGAHPAYPVWSPTADILYYRLGDDVWRWIPGSGASRFLTGTRWINPTISPDGRHVAYGVVGADGSTSAYLNNWPSPGQPQRIGPVLQGPVFLNNSQIWLMTLGVNNGCAGGEKPKPVIYNVEAHTTASSIIDGVRMVWPATSSNY
jgi:hypothetical protein